MFVPKCSRYKALPETSEAWVQIAVIYLMLGNWISATYCAV
jgi:hypothetical protein